MNDVAIDMEQMEAAIKAPVEPEPDPVRQYGEKYHQLRLDMLANGEAIAKNYEMLIERYTKMAANIREQTALFADRHIEDMLALDQAEEAIMRHFKPSNGNGREGS
jgi:hypothetical protein